MLKEQRDGGGSDFPEEYTFLVHKSLGQLLFVRQQNWQQLHNSPAVPDGATAKVWLHKHRFRSDLICQNPHAFLSQTSQRETLSAMWSQTELPEERMEAEDGG